MTSNSSADDTNRTRQRWLLGTMFVLVLPLVLVWWPGCRQYPAVTSKESLEMMRLLYTACNTKDPVRLARVEQGVAMLHGDGKMTPAEKTAYDKIIGLAKDGQWEAAEKAAFKFAQDQVGQGHPEPPVAKP